MLLSIARHGAPSRANTPKVTSQGWARNLARRATRPTFTAAAPAPAATSAVSPYSAILSPAFHSEYELPGLNEKPLTTECATTFDAASLSGDSTRTAETNPLRPRRRML